MSIYEILVRVISRGGYDPVAIQTKMDLYLLYDRITMAQYDEIMAMMQGA